MPTQTMRQFEKVFEILARYENNPAKLVPILQAVQAEYRFPPGKGAALCGDRPRLAAGAGFRGGDFLRALRIEAEGEVCHPCL